MFHEYQIVGYTDHGTLIRLGCLVFLLPNICVLYSGGDENE